MPPCRAFDAPGDWLCLAPVAVAPEEQGRGVATALLRHVVAELMAEKRTVVVLGEPRLYARAGFSSERASRLVSPYPLGATLIAGRGRTALGAADLQRASRGLTGTVSSLHCVRRASGGYDERSRPGHA